MNQPQGQDLVLMSPEEVRETLLTILEEIDSFCRQSGLVYQLYAGTLLGAVRHSGFIPWDDDADVMMPRADYDRFLATFKSHDDFVLVSRADRPTYPYASARVARRDTLVVEEVDIAPGERFGVSVDVLPYDAVPDHRFLFRLQVLAAWTVRALLLLKVVQPTRNRALSVRVLLHASRFILRPLPVRVLTASRERLAKAWGTRRSRHVAMLIASVPWRVPRTCLEPSGTIDFEGRTFSAPSDPHQLLASVYGDDYMTPPAGVADRAPHLSTAYRIR